ncbi:MAG TPA: hypothetical protein PLK82_03260, partial [Bacteroidales bacterium]|nr:hypothetical protein [Bacteroidales bacterium]
MKNRFYSLSLITCLFGITLLLTSLASVAGQPGNPETRKADGSWWGRMRANQVTGTVNPADVIQARQQAEALHLKSAGAASELNWIPAGPDNFTGMIWSAIFDNTDPTSNQIIAGSAMGGVWKSIDLGLTWTQLAVENNQSIAVSSLAQTSNGTIYAATGVTTCKSVTYPGSGIYRSSGGGTFTVIPATATNPDFLAVTKLVVAPSGRIYAGTIGGLYISENGDDWTKVKSGYVMDVCVGSDGTVIAAIDEAAYLADGGNLNNWVTLTTGNPNSLPNTGMIWMVFAIAPSDVNVIYASFIAPEGKLLNFYLSSDKGNTWNVVFPANPSYEPYRTGGKYLNKLGGCYSNTIAVFPDDPYKVYLGGKDMWYGKKVQGNGYYNWERISFGDDGIYSPTMVPRYHHSYMFRPNHPNQLVIASDGGVSIGTRDAFQTTFHTSNKNLKSSQFNSVAFSAQQSHVMGGGDRIGTLAMGYFCPSATSFPHDGYQVWRVDEAKINTNQLPQPFNYGGNGGTCEWSKVDPRVSVYTKDTVLRIRRQDFTDINSTTLFYKGINAFNTAHVPMRLWETYNQGQVFGITRDSAQFIADQKAIPADTTILVQSGQNRVLFPYHTLAPIAKGDTIKVPDPLATRFFIYGDSTDHNTSGAPRYPGIFMTSDLLRFNKIPDFYLIYKDPTPADTLTSMALSADLNTLWAGSQKGRLIRISGLVNAWDSATANIASSQCVLTVTEFNDLPFKGRAVTYLSIHPSNTNQVLVTLGNYGNQDYVYYSSNANAESPTFSSIQGNLPKAPVFTGLLEMSNSNTAIVGTDLGVYSTANLGSGSPNWTTDNLNMGIVPVTEIRQQVMQDYRILNTGVIYASTYGRGVWMETSHAVVGVDPVPGTIAISGSLKV